MRVKSTSIPRAASESNCQARKRRRTQSSPLLFPDYAFVLVGAVTEAVVKGKRTLALQWRMRGTQVRTKAVIDLPGVDFLAFDGPLILQANSHFDMLTLQKQSGLQSDELIFRLR